jgi:hypothetical protein
MKASNTTLDTIKNELRKISNDDIRKLFKTVFEENVTDEIDIDDFNIELSDETIRAIENSADEDTKIDSDNHIAMIWVTIEDGKILANFTADIDPSKEPLTSEDPEDMDAWIEGEINLETKEIEYAGVGVGT